MDDIALIRSKYQSEDGSPLPSYKEMERDIAKLGSLINQTDYDESDKARAALKEISLLLSQESKKMENSMANNKASRQQVKKMADACIAYNQSKPKPNKDKKG